LLCRAAVLTALLCAPAAVLAQTQLELTERAAKELSAAERQLKTVHDLLFFRYGAESNKRLRTAQDAWEVYRARLAELKRQLNCEEGDLSCVRD
jgi:hypothetical protein